MAASAAVEAPNAKAASTIVVPMALQAFVVSGDFSSTRYQVAPLVQPDFAALRPHKGEISHDLMDQLDMSFWRLQARYNPRFVDVRTGRVRPDRTGVYLSWCLPRLYRTGIAATGSAVASEEAQKAHDDKRVRSGYSKARKSKKDVDFRPVPDRWVIVRKSREGGLPSLAWLVESNCVRILDEELVTGDVDLDITTSPGIDTRPDSQHKAFIGRSAKLDKENVDGSGKRVYRTPFNAFENGHEFFADYQPHNMGVFSFFDNFQPGTQAHLVDYAVIGFHSSAADDPVAVLDAVAAGLTNQKLLVNISLELVPGDSKAANTFLGATCNSQGRTLTHGVLRKVRFGPDSGSLLRAPSIELQDLVYHHQPVAVGLHTLDALAAFLHVSAGHDENDNAAAAAHTLLSQLIMLIARDDDVDSQRKAADETALYGWVAQRPDTVWKLPKPDDKADGKGAGVAVPPTLPKAEVLRSLDRLNEAQLRFDTCQRELAHLRQVLFGAWWNAVGLRKLPPETHKDRRKQVQTQATETAAYLEAVIRRADLVEKTITKTLKPAIETLLGVKLAPGAARPHGRAQDPTLLFAGVKSGWPKAFAAPLEVRLASDIATSSQDATFDAAADLLGSVSEPLKPLLREFAESDDAKRGAWRPANPYVDLENMNDTQGWFPLFMEWEVEYYHIPFTLWDFELVETTGRWRYVIPPKNVLVKAAPDCRTLSGRTAIAPEAALTLRTRLKQLLDRTPDSKFANQRKEILKDAAELEYFSSPLAGFVDHLLTLRRGHLPRPSSGDTTIQDILGVSKQTLSELEKTPQELAPYGATTPLPPGYTAFSPFKPVTHGQFRFNKLAIVDRFGQVVSGLKPGENGGPGTALYPCVSAGLACSVLAPLDGKPDSEYWPNTAVLADGSPNVCQFVQVPPRINQAARLNAHFLRPAETDDASETRRAAGEWDNPIWAWLVVNFQGEAVQVYNGDGEFCLEIGLDDAARATRETINPRHLSLPPPRGRLAALLAEMRHNYAFARGLYLTLEAAADNARSSAADAQAMLPAAFGKPFCVADLGVSIELAAPPRRDTSLLTAPAAHREDDLEGYSFPVALGNPGAAFDGLAGTLAASGPLGKVATAHDVVDAAADAGLPVELSSPLRLNPYFESGVPAPGALPDLAAAHDRQLLSRTLIFDAACPVHIYSGSLFPLVEAAPPRWRVDAAVRRMQAVFAAGPTLVPAKPSLTEPLPAEPPVPPPVPPPILPPVPSPSVPPGPKPEPAVQMPLSAAAGGGAWRWLQPRKEDGATAWDTARIRPLDGKLGVEAAATSEIIEGFVLVQPSIPGSPAVSK